MTAQPRTAIAEARDLVRRFIPGALDDEIAELLDGYVKDGAWNLPGYVVRRGQKGHLERDLEAVRTARTLADETRAIDKARAGTECPHGVPGGEAPHPRTGLPLCPLCRGTAMTDAPE